MSRMWINKKNKKENVNKASCWILAVIFAVVVFGSAGLAAADEEESKEIPVLRIDGNVYDESGANRWYTEEPKVEVCLDGAAKISDKEIRDEEMQGEKIPDKEMQDEEIPDQEIYCNMQYEITYTSGEKKAETVNFTEQEEEGNWRYSFEPAVWKEGKNQLRLWQESETGETEWEQKAVICIDKTVPAAVVFSYPAGSEERGYCYQTETEMLVKSQDESSGVEKIIVQQDDGTKLEVEGAEGSVYLPLGYQGRLEAYAVDYAGLESVRSSSEQIICEDEKPLIAVTGVGKSGEWQKDLPKIRLWIGERSEKYTCSAGLRLAVCYVNGEEINRKYYENPTESDSFTVKLEKESVDGSPVELMVHAVDRAGNSTVRKEKLYIDRKSPTAEMNGVTDAMSTGETCSGEIVLKDENLLGKYEVSVTRTDQEKKKELILNQAKQELSEKEVSIPFVFEEDGHYECRIQVEDRAGWKTEKEYRFVIDRCSPVIRYVDQLNGTDLPFFQWNYEVEEAVSDLTDYQYQMLLDGLEYAKGRLVTEEGVHRLRVRAEDAAGNDSVAEAVFTIDHTPPVLYMGRLKDGAIYEEKVKIEVWVDGEKEYLTDLTLNGERQKLSTESRMFQCEIMESGNYIMGVQAEDAAGNQVKKVIRFEIRPGKSIVQKIWKPVEDLFSGHGEETENKMDQWIWAEIFGAAGILILLWYGWRMKRTGKRRK